MCRSSYSHCLSSVKKDEADSTIQFQQCIKILAERVALLIRQSAEMLERSKSVQAAHATLLKELEENKEVTKNLYSKLRLEKQVCLQPFVAANCISFTISHCFSAHTQQTSSLIW